jgi:hypothetical protein
VASWETALRPGTISVITSKNEEQSPPERKQSDPFIVHCRLSRADLRRRAPQRLAQRAQNVYEIVLDYLSVGIDPEKTTIYVQSQVPQVCELQLILL